MLKRFKAWMEARRLRRLWPVEEQLRQLRIFVESDSRWMAHDPKVAALTERYLDMLAPDWYARPVQDVSRFRDAIGCNPHDKRPVAPVSRDEFYRRLGGYKDAAIDFFQPGPTGPDMLNTYRASVQEAVNQLYAALDGAAAVQSESDEVMDMALCEAEHVVLRVGQLYRFKPVGDCEECAALAQAAREAYGEHTDGAEGAAA